MQHFPKINGNGEFLLGTLEDHDLFQHFESRKVSPNIVYNYCTASFNGVRTYLITLFASNKA